MMHIPQTGKIDAYTTRKMNSKRCGMADYSKIDKRNIAFATKQGNRSNTLCFFLFSNFQLKSYHCSFICYKKKSYS